MWRYKVWILYKTGELCYHFREILQALSKIITEYIHNLLKGGVYETWKGV